MPPNQPSDKSAGPADASVAARVVRLLELIASHDGGVGVREAARETGIDRSAVSRLLVQLESLDFVEKSAEGPSYGVGPAFFATAAAVRARDTLWQAAKPLLEELVAEHNETAYLTVRRGDRVIFLDKIECSHPIRYVVDLGTAFPLISGAAGRAILSTFPADEIERILQDGFEPFTEESFADASTVHQELATDQASGVSISTGRFVANGAGVAAPFFDDTGDCLGAVILSGPVDRIGAERLPTLTAAIKRAAYELSHRLGHR